MADVLLRFPLPRRRRCISYLRLSSPSWHNVLRISVGVTQLTTYPAKPSSQLRNACTVLGGELRLQVHVLIQREPNALDLPLPQYATPGAAGADLCAAVWEPVVLQPGQRCRIGTGVRIALPPGYEAQVRPRSGLADQYGLSMVNAPGTIDSDYRGEIQVILVNLGQEPVTIRRGDRIAQLVIAPVAQAVWKEVDSLPATERADGGFGSTGISSTE